MRALGFPGRKLTVVFVGARRMRDLNRRYLGRDYATDVLSFTYRDEVEDGSPFLGEVVIAPEVALRQARSWKTTLDRELHRLMLHGVLHLLGFDHEQDSGLMLRLQRRLLRRRALAHAEAVAELRNGE